MTDKEKLLKLFKEFNIDPKESPDGQMVSLVAHEGGVFGYRGFTCDFSFDKNGKFMEAGVWE